MIVVKLFARKQHAERNDIAAGVLHFVIPVADRVAEAIDNSGGPEGNPCYLSGPHKKSQDRTKHEEINGEECNRPKKLMGNEELALDHVIGAAFRILRDRFGIGGGIAVILDSQKEDLRPSVDDGRMRILIGLHESVMLAMNGNPLARI